MTVTGLKLAGLKKGHVASEGNVQDILAEVSKLTQLIIITHNLANHAKKDIEKIRRTGAIIVEIPDRSGGGESITDLVKEAVGLEIK